MSEHGTRPYGQRRGPTTPLFFNTVVGFLSRSDTIVVRARQSSAQNHVGPVTGHNEELTERDRLARSARRRIPNSLAFPGFRRPVSPSAGDGPPTSVSLIASPPACARSRGGACSTRVGRPWSAPTPRVASAGSPFPTPQGRPPTRSRRSRAAAAGSPRWMIGSRPHNGPAVGDPSAAPSAALSDD
jgi:hypothetical protein